MRWLDERSLPHFGQLATWLLLGASLVLAAYPWNVDAGQRQGPVSLLSWLPEAVLVSPAIEWISRAALVAGAILWLRRAFLPWSCWLTVAGFTCLWSLHVENSRHTNHCVQMTNNLLVIQALWETFCGKEIRAATAAGRFWQTPLYPRWASLGAVAYIGLFHTAAGLSKLAFSGFGWANGTSLQIWTYLWGYSWSPTTRLILHSRTFAEGVQAATLVIETAGVLAIVPHLRTWIGVATIGFYAGMLLTFNYGFQLNLMFTILYLLPVERWVEDYVRDRSRIEVARA